MKKYLYKDQIITANSKEEAKKVVATAATKTNPAELKLKSKGFKFVEDMGYALPKKNVVVDLHKGFANVTLVMDDEDFNVYQMISNGTLFKFLDSNIADLKKFDSNPDANLLSKFDAILNKSQFEVTANSKKEAKVLALKGAKIKKADPKYVKKTQKEVNNLIKSLGLDKVVQAEVYDSGNIKISLEYNGNTIEYHANNMSYYLSMLGPVFDNIKDCGAYLEKNKNDLIKLNKCATDFDKGIKKLGWIGSASVKRII